MTSCATIRLVWPGTRGSSRRSAGSWPTRRRRRRGAAGPPAGSRNSPYATLTSWSCQRRVVAKAEHLPNKANPRFVVTSLPQSFSARTVYERVYCPRGNMENAIKEQQLDLFSDGTSASRFAANQLRLLFSAFASILFDVLRRALEGTLLARATAGTLRLKLLKIGASVSVSVRRLKVAMDCAHPSAAAFARVHARLFRVASHSTSRHPLDRDQDAPGAMKTPSASSSPVSEPLRQQARGPSCLATRLTSRNHGPNPSFQTLIDHAVRNAELARGGPGRYLQPASPPC